MPGLWVAPAAVGDDSGQILSPSGMVRVPGQSATRAAASVIDGIYGVASPQADRGCAADVIGLTSAAKTMKEIGYAAVTSGEVGADQPVAVWQFDLDALASDAQPWGGQKVSPDSLGMSGSRPEWRYARLESQASHRLR
jgi:hypothetical protein